MTIDGRIAAALRPPRVPSPPPTPPLPAAPSDAAWRHRRLCSDAAVAAITAAPLDHRRFNSPPPRPLLYIDFPRVGRRAGSAGRKATSGGRC